MALKDMSDNANTFGTSLESVQNAYQGFAKGNFSMLDNLKLGYGGTQKEMFRLMTDAQALDKSFDAVFKLDEKGHLEANFHDMVKAINIVQIHSVFFCDPLGIIRIVLSQCSNIGQTISKCVPL